MLPLVRSGGVSLAVVDGSDPFLGLIPPERMLAVLVEEHDDDIARLGGTPGGRGCRRRSIDVEESCLGHV